MKNQRGFISDIDLTGMMIALVVIGVAIGFVLSVGLPWLWGLLKPWIHAITA